MKESDRYLKIVEWSDEDQKYIGFCPEWLGGVCHGDDEVKVYKDLCGVVEWVIEDSKKHGDFIPEPKRRDSYSGLIATCAPLSEPRRQYGIRLVYEDKIILHDTAYAVHEDVAVYNPGEPNRPQMKDSARYLKIVEWSAEKEKYVGTCPELFDNECVNDNEVKVYRQLCKMADEAVGTCKQNGTPLPRFTMPSDHYENLFQESDLTPKASTITNENSQKIVLRVSPAVHKVLAIRAIRVNETLNRYCSNIMFYKLATQNTVPAPGESMNRFYTNLLFEKHTLLETKAQP